MAKKMILVLAVLAVLTLGSCATYSTVSGVRTPLGMLTSSKVNDARAGAAVIAEYQIILGLITSGYEDFLAATKGQDVDIVNIDYFGFFSKVQAIPRSN